MKVLLNDVKFNIPEPNELLVCKCYNKYNSVQITFCSQYKYYPHDP